jgi:hypothetical protein
MSTHEETNEYARWEARFATPDYAFGKEPNYFLKSCRQLVPRRGGALALADGEGRNGVWLAEQGLSVTSLDFSPAPQNKAGALAAERGVKVTFVAADVHGWDYPEAAFDLVVEIFAQFSGPPQRAINGVACGGRSSPADFSLSRATRPNNCITGPADQNTWKTYIHGRCSSRNLTIFAI